MANRYDADYAILIRSILDRGELIDGRNGQMVELFAASIRFDVGEGFPILQGRKLYPRGVFGELSAFLKGVTTLAEFEAEGCPYWKLWAFPDGTLGPIYGAQWRNWGPEGHDQLQALVEGIKQDPHSRRHLVTNWNPTDMSLMCLPPCFPTFQVRISQDNRLDLLVNQRSCDVMIGLPSDIILFATLMHLLANGTGKHPGELVFNLGSAHIYWKHRSQVLQYLKRLGENPSFFAGHAELAHYGMTIDNFDPSHVQVHNYRPLPPLGFELFE